MFHLEYPPHYWLYVPLIYNTINSISVNIVCQYKYRTIPNQDNFSIRYLKHIRIMLHSYSYVIKYILENVFL